MWAVPMAIEDALHHEIDAFACSSAIELLIRSPTMQTLRLSFLERDHVIGLVGGQHLREKAVHPQRLGQRRVGLVIPGDVVRPPAFRKPRWRRPVSSRPSRPGQPRPFPQRV